MLVLDNMLVKLFLSGHRVLLFSTMTKLLDTVERYLRCACGGFALLCITTVLNLLYSNAGGESCQMGGR